MGGVIWVIWIVTKSLVHTDQELINRREYISTVTDCKVTQWMENKTVQGIPFFSCISQKGEFGLFISAHMISEVPAILKEVIPRKRSVVVINSCGVKESEIEKCVSIVKQRNNNSIVYWSKQEQINEFLVSYMDDVGTFGFSTTISERELFQNRRLGLMLGIKKSFVRRDIDL